MAGHKGFGLAVMWEVLTGVLAGGAQFAQDVRLPGDADRPQGVSVFLLAIDPEAVMPRAEFEARVDRLIASVHATPTLVEGASVRVPGEQSHATAERRSRDGVPYPPDVAATFAQLGAELGVPWPG